MKLSSLEREAFFSLKMRSIAPLLNRSAPSPYRVSVG